MQIDGLVRATDPDLWRHLFVCQAPLQWALAPAQVDSRLSWEGVGGVGHYFMWGGGEDESDAVDISF